MKFKGIATDAENERPCDGTDFNRDRRHALAMSQLGIYIAPGEVIRAHPRLEYGVRFEPFRRREPRADADRACARSGRRRGTEPLLMLAGVSRCVGLGRFAERVAARYWDAAAIDGTYERCIVYPGDQT
jgi:hypothetical protein